MASAKDRLRAAEALAALSRAVERGLTKNVLVHWVDLGKSDGYYLRVVLPDDVFPAGVSVVKESPSLD